MPPSARRDRRLAGSGQSGQEHGKALCVPRTLRTSPRHRWRYSTGQVLWPQGRDHMRSVTMGALVRFVRRLRYGRPIVVVSGLPRSGTSMMMQMLQAGGLEILTDAVRTPDGSNPKGYFEFEAVKDLDKGPPPAWLTGARGKAVKIVSSLVRWLPESHDYQVIFMRRDLDEVILSQNKMLVDRRVPSRRGSERPRQAPVPDARRGHAAAPARATLGLHARGRLQRGACAAR